ncbi:MAG: YHYH domain-containing protein [Eubacterium aggregans]
MGMKKNHSDSGCSACLHHWLPAALAHSGRTDKNGCHKDHNPGIRYCY